jgi:FAD/FMN-containing dehydrogenase/Fe-S oxidoreductase
MHRPSVRGDVRDFKRMTSGKGVHGHAPAHARLHQELSAELRRHIEGEVRFDEGSRALYATDSSNYRQTPVGVVIPRHKQDVINAIAICRQFGAPITSRGGGTSLAGQCCNVAVILDFSKYMRRITELDPARKRARVEPGVILDQLRNAAEEYHLTFGSDTSTHQYATLGGVLGNNACGVHSVMGQFLGGGARTSDNVEEMEILTYDGLQMRVGATSEEQLQRFIRERGRKGEIYSRLLALRNKYAHLIRARYPQIPRRVSGYNLDDLLPEKGFNVARALVGSEGTCVTILEAAVQLIPSPPERVLAVLGFPDVYIAADHVPDVMSFQPTGLEGLDEELVEDMRTKCLLVDELHLLPEGKGWLLAEFGGSTIDQAREKAENLVAQLKKRLRTEIHTRVFVDPKQQDILWEIRESGLGATARVPGRPDAWEGWEDAAVPPEKLGDYLRDFRRLLSRFDYTGPLYGHFGQGCVHTRINFGLKSAGGVRAWRSFLEEAADLVVRYGGSLSGEHGDGQARGELLHKMFGPELVEAFREFKAIWDPQGKMNPHKVADPYGVDENLRYGPDYDPPQWKTHFQFPGDNGSFASATERCVGVGKCRKEEAGVMCPSYMVTRDELHSTRGRARMLFEMLQGKVIGKNGWRDPSVKASLDLCLACKACKSECPIQVDMATYKAEFFSHYYQGRLRPMTAYAMGLIYWWARIASPISGLANFFTQNAPFNTLAKWAGGIARQRQIPPFAPETFRDWFQRRPALNQGRPIVLLWPDTFTNFFEPHIGRAAVQILEQAGFQVTIPPRSLCCGRPLYDFGMLDTAKFHLRQILEHLRPQIEHGIPVISLEPSCAAVFRDELTELFPNQQNARRLASKTFTLGEFLQNEAPFHPVPELRRKAIVHGHCHHKSVLDLKSDLALLKRIGLDFEYLDAGCCGMAGSFGYEHDKYEVSVQCGERVLLPAARQADPETLIISDGFSCRQQIEQLAHRKAMHTAEVLQLALNRGRIIPEPAHASPLLANKWKLATGAALLGAAACLLWSRHRT